MSKLLAWEVVVHCEECGKHDLGITIDCEKFGKGNCSHDWCYQCWAKENNWSKEALAKVVANV